MFVQQPKMFASYQRTDRVFKTVKWLSIYVTDLSRLENVYKFNLSKCSWFNRLRETNIWLNYLQISKQNEQNEREKKYIQSDQSA
jgi:hypothetical protein